MSKPTKKERHAIYKKALKEIESPDEFLCIIAWSVGGKKYGGIGQMPDLLPELGAQYKGRMTHEVSLKIVDRSLEARDRINDLLGKDLFLLVEENSGVIDIIGYQNGCRVYHNGGWFRTKADRRAALIRCIELSKPAKRK